MKIDPNSLNLKIEEYNEHDNVNSCFKNRHFVFNGLLPTNYGDMHKGLPESIDLQSTKDRIRRNIDSFLQIKWKHQSIRWYILRICKYNGQTETLLSELPCQIIQ